MCEKTYVGWIWCLKIRIKKPSQLHVFENIRIKESTSSGFKYLKNVKEPQYFANFHSSLPILCKFFDF
jgi:hypothetical protein